jgi:hypothetical protein
MALFATGLLLLLILLVVFTNFDNFLKIDYVNKIMLLSLITIAVGIHGLLHLGLEVNYNYNPFNLFSK